MNIDGYGNSQIYNIAGKKNKRNASIEIFHH